MKIIHIIGYFQPDYGYEENHTAFTQLKNGHDVHIITSKYSSPFNGLTKEQRILRSKEYLGVKIHRLNSLEFYTDFIFLIGLEEILISLNPDIVHCHTTTQMASIQGIRYSNKLNICCVIDCHEFNFKGSSLNPLAWTLRSILKFLEFKYFRIPLYLYILSKKSNLKYISLAPVCTEYLINEFKISKEKIIELNLCVSVEESQNLNIEKSKSDFGWFDSDRVFVFTGVVSARKRLIDYITIFKYLPPNYKLLMILKGNTFELERIIYESSLSERIKIVKGVNSNQVFEYYKIADIGLWIYNNSISYLEAIFNELPVCLSDMQLAYLMPKDLIFLLEPDLEVNEVVEKLLEFDFSDKRLSEISVRAKDYLIKNLTYDSYVQKLDQIYANLINE